MANLYGPRIVTDGLVLHLDAANRKSYPGSGTSWYDISGNGGYAVLTNGPTFTTQDGGGISFDDVNDYARITRSDLNAGSFAYGNITCEIWLKPAGASTSGTGNNIITVENSWELSIGYLSNGYYSLYQASNPWAWYGTDSNPIAGNAWSQIIFTHSNTTSSLHVNTTQVHTRSNSGALGGGGSYPYLTLMGRQSGTVNNCGGVLSVVKIYNRVLSSSEISSNYNALKGRFGL